MIKGKEFMREKIISSAMKVFSKYGYFRASVQLIAKEAGVSKGLIFWYFRSKYELIMEIARRNLPLEIIDSCLEKDLKGRSMLECIGRSYIDKYRDPVQRNLLLHTLALTTSFPKIAEDIRRLCEEKTKVIAEKVFGEASPRARIAIRAFFGGLMCYVLRPLEGIDEQAFLENLIDIVLAKQRAKKQQ